MGKKLFDYVIGNAPFAGARPVPYNSLPEAVEHNTQFRTPFPRSRGLLISDLPRI